MQKFGQGLEAVEEEYNKMEWDVMRISGRSLARSVEAANEMRRAPKMLDMPLPENKLSMVRNDD